jgi:hypothetical protein
MASVTTTISADVCHYIHGLLKLFTDTIFSTRFLLITIPITLAILIHLRRRRLSSLQPSNAPSNTIEYNIPHLISTSALLLFSIGILIDWFRTLQNLQPLSGFIYCPYRSAGPEITLAALGIVKFEFEKQFEMLLAGPLGFWVALREAQALKSVSLRERPLRLIALVC